LHYCEGIGLLVQENNCHDGMLSTLKLDCFGLQISFPFCLEGGWFLLCKQLLIVLRCGALLWYPIEQGFVQECGYITK